MPTETIMTDAPAASLPPPPSSRLPRMVWFVSALAALIAVGAWAFHVTRLTNEAQRALVPTSTVWGMHACLVAAAAGLGGVSFALRTLLSRRQVLTALALVVAGWLACGIAPGISRIFFDEHIYMQIGQTIAHTGRAEGANYARAEYGKFEMYAPWTNKQPNGLPYLLSWIYRVAGVSDAASHFLNRALVGLAAAAIYLGLALVPWTLPRGAPLAAAALFIATPLVLWWGHTVATEPAAATTAAFAFFAVCVHARLRDRETAQGRPASALLLAAATAFAGYFRPESLLVFPVGAAVLWSTDDRFIEDLSAWAALAFAAALATPNLLHLWSVRTEDWGARDGHRFGFDFLGKNLHSNGGYFFNSQWFPVAGTLLALLGALWLLRRNRTAGVALGAWFALSWGIFVLFYAGGYYYGASSRYAVVSCAPVAIFMGIGVAGLFGRLRARPALAWAAGAALAINWAAAFHFVPTRGREAAEAVADSEFVAEASRALPDGSLVISPDPCMWLLQGRNAAQIFTLDGMIHSQLRELASQYPGGIYLHWSFWHNAEPVTARTSATLIAETHAMPFLRHDTQNYKLALFRLDTPEALAKFGGERVEDPHADRDLDLLLTAARAAAEKPAPEAAKK
jgi:hypothetical protein